MPKDTSVGGDKDSRANFWGWIIYFWKEYADGMDEEANSDFIKKGTDFVEGEVNSSPYEHVTFIAFLLSRHWFEGYPYEKIISRQFLLAIKLDKRHFFLLAPYFLGTLYSHMVTSMYLNSSPLTFSTLPSEILASLCKAICHNFQPLGCPAGSPSCKSERMPFTFLLGMHTSHFPFECC